MLTHSKITKFFKIILLQHFYPKLSNPDTLCLYSCNAGSYFLSNSPRKGKAYSTQNDKINLRLTYFSADQIHFFVTPYSWDINLLISQAIKMQWLILLLTTLPETNTAGMQYANTISRAAFSCTCFVTHFTTTEGPKRNGLGLLQQQKSSSNCGSSTQYSRK